MAVANVDVSIANLKEAMKSHAQILNAFQVVHDLCEQNKLFSSDIVCQINSCAIGFKMLSKSTVQVVERNSQWIDRTIGFYETINDDKTPKETLKRYGNQARELAKCFRAIAKWGRSFCGIIHEVNKNTSQDVKRIEFEHQEAVANAKVVEGRKSGKLDRARQLRADAEAEERRWKTALAATWWNPIGLVVTSIGSGVSSNATAEAARLEREASDEYNSAVRKVEAKIHEKEIAKLIISKVQYLLNAIEEVEGSCEKVAAFWTIKADEFDSQGGNMSTSQQHMLNSMKKSGSAIVKKNIDYWIGVKQELSYYVSVADIQFNFETLKETKMKVLHLPMLGLNLSIPNDIDI